MNYALHLVVTFDIYLIAALSLNLVVGYAGLVSLAHAGYFALGAYAYAVLTINTGCEFVLAAAVAAVVAAALSLCLSLPSWRLRGDFFVLVSIAVQAVVLGVLTNWPVTDSPAGTWANPTNGPFGITGIPRPVVAGSRLTTPAQTAAFATVAAALVVAVLWRLMSSPWGRLVVAMRDDDLAARGVAKDTRLVRVEVFAVASASVAVAGSLYAAHVRFLDPSLGSIDHSILILSMAIIGGLGNVRGSVVGALVLTLLPEVLRLLRLPDALAANVRLLMYSALLILVIHLRPQGIAGSYKLD